MQEVFENIIERLRAEKDIDRSRVYSPEQCDAIRYSFGAAIDAVKVVAEQYNNGWIPVSERLPEKNKPVLCWVRSTTIASGETFIIGSCDRGFWFLQTYEIGHHHFPVKDYEVLAWQPLPEPYQEGE